MQVLLDFFKRMVKDIERAQSYRRAVSELESLTDNQLKDMGVHRCDIHRVVAQNVAL
jgi:uncharacterized protein YjiS (DUF1127 family)